MMIKTRKCTQVAFLTAGALLALLSFQFSRGQTPNVENTIEIREIAGVTSLRYPIQIGRPFLKGEIPDHPQVLLDGQPVTSQADVKTRWPDGSVKHAVLTFVIPTLQAGSTLKVSFANAPEGGHNHGLTAQEMLSPEFDFDAQMELTDAAGKGITASAREMLRTGHFERWLNGPVATSIVLADHSPDACFDMGFGSFESFRPIVHATFWPQISKVRVRFIGEVANTEFLQDMHYSLALMTGDRKKVQVYEKPLFTHHAGSRWTKEFWIGGSPSPVEIDPNPAYLAATGFIPNYDLTKTISEGAMGKAYGQWLASPKDLLDSGLWVRAMGTAGGRSEIGPYPTWTVRWFYTGDARMREIAFGQADLAAAWPMHLRESKPGKRFLRTDPPGSSTGFGKALSLSGRPSICLWSGFEFYYTLPEDEIVPVGDVTDQGWAPDGAHQPDPFSVQYTLSGDFWYLEEMYFWASFSAARYSPNSFWGRGPTGAEGGIHDETRGDAWVFRNRVQTAFLAPDGTPEKSYFNTLIDDALSIWEGVRDIKGTGYQGNSTWLFGQNCIGGEYKGLGIPVLRHWDCGNDGLVQDPLDPSVVKMGASPWEENFVVYALGRAKELGYPSGPLFSWYSLHLIGLLTHPDFDPYLIAAYRIPTARLSDGNYFNSFKNLKQGYLASYDAKDRWIHHLADPEHGYSFIAMAAASFVKYEPGGSAAWDWMVAEALGAPSLQDNPKWALVPRPQSGLYSYMNPSMEEREDRLLAGPLEYKLARSN